MDLSGKYIAVEGTWGVKEIAPISEQGQRLSNPNFENWTAGDPDDWNVANDDANNYVEQNVNGLRFVYDDDNPSALRITQSALTIGKWYRWLINIPTLTGGIIPYCGSSQNLGDITSVGVYELFFQAGATDVRIYRDPGADADVIIKESSIEEVPEAYPFFDKGDTYLAGIGGANKIAFPCRQAFGRWEFLFYKDLDTSSTTFNFVCGDVNGTVALYKLIFLSTECIRIRRDSTNIMESSASYIEIQTWYKLRITRTKAGVITFEIMGGAFGIDAWTLIDASVTGTNHLWLKHSPDRYSYQIIVRIP